MNEHIIDEKTGIPYTLARDYYLPWGDMPDDEQEQEPIGIWGQRHLRYLKRNKKTVYADLLFSGRLNDYLADIDKQANKMLSRLISQFAENEGVTESLKASNQMAWVKHMNSFRNRAEEVTYSELIYT